MRSPFKYNSRLAAGDGAKASVNAVFTPFTLPAGTSPSEKLGSTPPPELPHGPELPSTRMQSLRFPAAASIWPAVLITAVLPSENPTPFIGVSARAFCNPTTSEICTGDVTGRGPTTAPVETRTSRICSVTLLGGTAHTWENWFTPLLLNTTLYCAPADAVVVGASCTLSTPSTTGTVRFAVAMLDASP